MKRKQRLSKLWKKSIFSKMVLGYIVFAVSILLTFIICMIGAMIFLSSGNDDNMPPNAFVNEAGEIITMETIEKLGGWVEELDEEYRVLRVYGDKKTDSMQYSRNEMISLTSVETGEPNYYIGFLKYIEKKGTYFLCIYERNLVQIRLAVILDAQNEGADNVFLGVIVVFFLLCFINVLLICAYLNKKIKMPLQYIVNGMEKVKNGEGAVCLDFAAEREFESIRDTFNLMSRDLEKSKREKEEMEHKKAQLLLELSHDIKTPLATIKSYVNALESGLVPESKIPAYYQTIDKKADRVCSLSENMFLMLKMDNADYKLQLQRTDLCEVMRQVCAEYYEEIESAGYLFDIEIPEQPYYRDVDEKTFTRVITNLLTNAIKYNQVGEQIGVSVKQETEYVQIAIWDDGVLIAEDMRKSIFDAFVRGDKARKSDGGTGLGLSISKVIIEKHGGKLFYDVRNGKNYFIIQM
ncbi:MAG: HAMP domain-containing histidine kinase [Lachnospiraceae bacterium]|nr:HAMP domain-containing histidine kinase [Lachnospiraceae bacterium]